MQYDGASVKAWAGDSQWRALQADYARFRAHGLTGWGSEGFWAIAVYRLNRHVRALEPKWAWAPVRVALNVARKMLYLMTSVDLHQNATIGPGLLIRHGGQIRVHAETRIGADCILSHVCTIGNSNIGGAATIGDHVTIGCHSSILGPITIGDYATIGANSAVIADVPAGATVMGVPARMLPGAKRDTPHPN